MKKIFEDSKDVHVSANIVYAGEDDYAYVDADNETKISKAELVDCFVKGLIVSTETGLVKPYIITVEDDYASVSYDDGTELVTLYSEGYEENTEAEPEVTG